MAEAFVKTLKRDYVRVSPIGDAAAALTLKSIAGWRTTTLFTRTPGWAIAHRENTSMLNPNPPRVRPDRVNSIEPHLPNDFRGGACLGGSLS